MFQQPDLVHTTLWNKKLGQYARKTTADSSSGGHFVKILNDFRTLWASSYHTRRPESRPPQQCISTVTNAYPQETLTDRMNQTKPANQQHREVDQSANTLKLSANQQENEVECTKLTDRQTGKG